MSVKEKERDVLKYNLILRDFSSRMGLELFLKLKKSNYAKSQEGIRVFSERIGTTTLADKVSARSSYEFRMSVHSRAYL